MSIGTGLKHTEIFVPEFEPPSLKQAEDFVAIVERAKENNEVCFISFLKVISFCFSYLYQLLIFSEGRWQGCHFFTKWHLKGKCWCPKVNVV